MNGPHDAALVAVGPRPHHGPTRNAPGDTHMIVRPHRLAAAALGVAVVTATAALPARAQLQLYAKAKSEGAVKLYVGGPTAPWEAMAKKFGERYPGITFAI